MVTLCNRIGATSLWHESAPLGFAAGDTNLYRYVGNSPTNLTDPSGLAAVGHHWVPVSVLTDAGISHWLSMDAYHMGMGAFSGPTQPTHCFTTYGGVSHAEYNKIIKEELQQLIKKNGGKTISGDQMTKFIENLQAGNDHTGRANPKIKSFNDAVAAERAAYVAVNPKARGFKKAQTPAQWQTQGKWYLEGPGSDRVNGKVVIKGLNPPFNPIGTTPPPDRVSGKSVIKGAMIVSAIGGWVIYDTPQAMACAADSPHFKNAVKSLSEGDIYRAERHLFGAGNEQGSYCFYQELVDKVDPKYAIAFREMYYAKMKEVSQRCDSPIMRYTEPPKK